MLKKFAVLLGMFAVVLSAAAAEQVAKLNYKNLVIPTLKPAGSGDLKGSVVHYMMRGQNVVFFCVKDGEEIKAVVKHFGGKNRMLAISYVILDQQKKIMQEGTVSRGKIKTISYKAPKAGTYALVLTSGKGPVAWYTVHTKNPFAAVSAVDKEAYIFGKHTIYVPGKSAGYNELKVRSSHKESYAYSVNDGEKAESLQKPNTVIQLPDTPVVKIQFSAIPKTWAQNFWISVDGQKPLLIFFGPNRAVEVVK